MSDQFKSIIVFTDGACSGNPGPGGWAAILAHPNGRVKELGGGDPQTTNNRMEMLGVIKALRTIPKGDTPITVYTDSTYTIRGITQWIWGWKKRGWKNAEGGEVSNRDLWEALLAAVLKHKPLAIEWRYVRGHTGVPGNERCDEISVAYSKGQWVELYDGPLLQYPVAIHDIPEDKGLPEMRPNDKKKEPAYSYLSYHGGVVMRHKTWAECERRVKGQSAAKFKKAKSATDEASILKTWGLSDKTKIDE